MRTCTGEVEEKLINVLGEGIDRSFERLATKLLDLGKCQQNPIQAEYNEDDAFSYLSSNSTGASHKTDNRGEEDVGDDTNLSTSSSSSFTSMSSLHDEVAPSSAGCCAFLETRESWEDDTWLSNDPFVPVATSSLDIPRTNSTCTNDESNEKELECAGKQIELEHIIPTLGDKEEREDDSRCEVEARYDGLRLDVNHDAIVTPTKEESSQEQVSVSKGRRRGSFFFTSKKKINTNPHVRVHCIKGRCPAAKDDSSAKNFASQTLGVVHTSVLLAIRKKQWSVLLDLVKANPEVLTIHSSEAAGGTILHSLACSADAPDAVILKILAIRPTIAGCRDDYLNTPLHLAARQANRPGLVKLFSDYFVPAAVAQNADLDTPLHIAAATGAGGEDSVRILLNANPGMVQSTNSRNRLPLHEACLSSTPSVESVRSFLVGHGAIHHHPFDVDEDGDSPLCAAIKNNASLLIPSFAAFGRDLFQPPETSSMPLHTALLCEQVGAGTLKTIIAAGPLACTIPLPSGEMPIQLVTRRGLCDGVVHSVLVQDLPVTDVDVSNCKDIVTEKEHNYSWHHVLIDAEDRYGGVISKILSASSLWCRIALAKSLGPDGRCAYDASSEATKALFRFILCIGGRFEVKLGESREFPVVVDGDCRFLQAIDLAPSVDQRGNEKTSDMMNHGEGGVEVIIRCYKAQANVVNELFIRRAHRVSDKYIEALIHHLPAHECMLPTSYLLVFEKAEVTLQAVLDEGSSSDQDRQRMFKQIAKALHHLHDKGLIHGHLVLKNVAKFGSSWKLTNVGKCCSPIFTPVGGGLRHCIPPESVVKVTGSQARAPSMQVSLAREESSLTTTAAVEDDAAKETTSSGASSDVAQSRASSRRRRRRGRGLLFSLKDLGVQPAESNCSKSLRILSESKDVVADTDGISNTANNDDRQPAIPVTLQSQYRFAPEISASPTFDIFALGLMFVQSYLGRCTLLPTVDKKAPDVYLSSTYSFNNEKLQNIKKRMAKAAGKEAADLATKMLNPNPNKRIQTMNDILDHDYFDC